MENEQEKLNAAMKQHLENVKGWGYLLKFLGCAALVGLGYVFLIRTNLAFGDVPVVLGLYWMGKIIKT